MVYRLLVAGSRFGFPESIIMRELKAIRDEVDGDIILVHGDAPGVDQAAARIGISMGMKPEPHGANWKKYGTRAGPIRNAEMVALGADRGLFFPHPTKPSAGTYDCYNKARDAGILVKIVENK